MSFSSHKSVCIIVDVRREVDGVITGDTTEYKNQTLMMLVAFVC